MPDPYEIAAWRFEQIAPLIDTSLDAAARRTALRKRSRQAVTWPGAQERQRRGLAPIHKPIPRSTLYRWLSAYRQAGYPGLIPRPRRDRGIPRRADTAAWIGYAIGLLYEQPQRSLTQLGVYLQAEFADYDLSRSSLARALHTHPAFAGVDKLRKGTKTKLRSLYQAQHPHEGWQLDAKGPFVVRLKDTGRATVHVLSILDDYSRSVLAALVAPAANTNATISVFEKAGAKWGLPDRFQFDLGAAFESKPFRHGLAQLGIHRNAVKARTPEWQGKIEAYHRCLGRWFVNELASQQVINLHHLQQLLEAMIALVYHRHQHRTLGTTPDKRLAGRLSPRPVSLHDLERAFFVPITAPSHPKTGEVHLPNGRFRVTSPYAGRRHRFRYHPVHPRALLVAADNREIELQPFTVKPLSAVPPQDPPCGTGQLQKLLDQWHGHTRPNAQPGFGLPEVFTELASLLGRLVPDSEREARTVLAFYRQHGPLPREAFLKACARTANNLGQGRPLTAYLDHLARQISASHDPDPELNP